MKILVPNRYSLYIQIKLIKEDVLDNNILSMFFDLGKQDVYFNVRKNHCNSAQTGCMYFECVKERPGNSLNKTQNNNKFELAYS